MVLFDLLRLIRKVFHELFDEMEKLNIHQDGFVQIYFGPFSTAFTQIKCFLKY